MSHRSKTDLPDVVLQPGREHSVQRRHPWIFSGAIASRSDDGVEGELVTVRDSRGRALGCGYTSAEGSIAVKMLHFGGAELEPGFWVGRVKEAAALRRRLGLFDSKDTSAFRLLNAEGDGVPGLICDHYGSTLVVQFQSAGISLQREAILEALLSGLPAPAAVYLKNREGKPRPNETASTETSGYLYGEKENTVVAEGGIRFEIDWERGQKTGFFLDQRDNRALLRRLAGGARVLNTFCYTGGFSINALAGGAASVVSVDTSAAALEILERNLSQNSFDGSHETVRDDVLQFVERDNRTFDIIVLDPPAFVKHRGALRGGLQGYRKINRFGFERVEAGGLLFTFSCSQAVTPELFREEVLQAARESGRTVQVLYQLHQAPCHPVSLFHPEGEYLKGLVVRVGE